jgi:hypothetical protein
MEESTDNDCISRKEAVTKISKYAALTALGTFMILSPQKAQAGSPTHGGSGGWRDRDPNLPTPPPPPPGGGPQ